MNKRVILILSFIITLLSTTVASAGTIFNLQEEVQLSKGVKYIKSERITEKGFLDLNIIEININDSNISLKPIFKEQVGIKDNVVNLVNESGAIAGINGDYFGISGTYTAAFSPEVSDGEVMSYSVGRNASSNRYSSFILTDENNAFFDYLKTEIHFKNNGVENMEINGINKVRELVYPEIVTGDRVSTNESFVSRFPNLSTIVVDNGFITYISAKNEVVSIPETGYAVLVKEASADYFLQFFKIGQTAELELTSSFDIDKIKTSIGGAGKILENGVIVNDTADIVNGMQPRSAIGVTSDNRILLVTIDGRQKSVGATHAETAQILKELGCVSAMHLDGGGSTTMAVKEKDENVASLVNTPSDGAMRKVINGLGVFIESEIGPTKTLEFDMSDKIAVGGSLKINLKGYDEYLRKTDIEANVEYTFDEAYGYILDGYYYAEQNTGKTAITASYNGISVTKEIQIVKLNELSLSSSGVYVDLYDTANLTFKGIDSNGDSVTVSGKNITYEYSNPALGIVENNIFTSANNGTGWIKASLGDIYTYFKVTVGRNEKNLYNFDGAQSFTAYPSTVTGSVNGKVLNYNFAPETNTKAAYLVMDNGISITDGTSELLLTLKGDNSGNWLRGLIVDKNGTEHRVDFTKSINFSDEKELSAVLPTGIVYPAKLTRLYVTSTEANTTDFYGSITFVGLKSIIPVENNIVLPESPKYKGNTGVAKFDVESGPNSYDIIITGDYDNGDTTKNSVNTANSKIKVQTSVDYLKNNQLSNNYFILGGTNTFGNTANGAYYSQYSFKKFNDTGIMQIVGAGGSISNNNIYQWNSMYYDAVNNNCKSLIIISDVNPQNFNSNEKSYFHRELLKLEKLGIDVFVVSTEKNLSMNKDVDGIKYINLNDTAVTGGVYTKKGEYVIIRFDEENEYSLRKFN